MEYIRGKGFPEVATRDSNGNFVAPFRSLGDLSTYEARFGTEKFTLTENVTGLGKTVISATTAINSELSLQLRNWNLKNLALAVFGAAVDVAQVTIAPGAEEVFPTGLLVGDVINLANKGKVSSLIVIDSTGSPVTLTLNTHYRHDGYGRIEILSLGSLVQPFKASYVAAAIKRVPILNLPPADLWFRFWSKNTVEKNTDGSFKRSCWEFYKVQMNPTETLALIQDNEAGVLPLTGTILADETKPETSTTSQYGNIYILD